MFTESAFKIRQMQHQHGNKGNKLYNTFTELKKAFDRLYRDATGWALMKVDIKEWLLAMYEGVPTMSYHIIML